MTKSSTGYILSSYSRDPIFFFFFLNWVWIKRVIVINFNPLDNRSNGDYSWGTKWWRDDSLHEGVETIEAYTRIFKNKKKKTVGRRNILTVVGVGARCWGLIVVFFFHPFHHEKMVSPQRFANIIRQSSDQNLIQCPHPYYITIFPRHLISMLPNNSGVLPRKESLRKKKKSCLALDSNDFSGWLVVVVVFWVGELSWTARCWACGWCCCCAHKQLPFGHWPFIVGYNVTFDRPPRRQRMPTCADNGHRISWKVPPMQPRRFVPFLLTYFGLVFFSICVSSYNSLSIHLV